MRSRLSLLALLIAVLLLPGSGVTRAAGEAARAERLAIDRFINNAIEKEPVPYQARRRLEGAISKLNETGWMEVSTEYTREQGFRYQVLSQGGSDRIRTRALRKVLEAEQQNLAEWRKGALIPENYDFNFDGLSPDGLIRVDLNPRRQDSRLVDGTVWLSPSSGEMVRLEGRLSKSPSFWVRWVNVTRRYLPVRGLMMPSAVESTADIRMAGLSTFSMTYNYSTIDGHPLHSSPELLTPR